MNSFTAFPRQMLPYKSKGEKWGRACVDWGANHTYFNCSPIRKSVVQMKINYDLLNGIVHMEDMAKLLNPGDISTMFIPDKVQHYPIINSKINTLRGELSGREFRWKAIVVNPNSISAIEERKTEDLRRSLAELVQDTQMDEQQAENSLDDIYYYYHFNWMDENEVQCNDLLRYYSKRDNFKQTFNGGFVDAATVANEIYMCGIINAEPVLKRLNPLKVRVLFGDYSNRVEDAGIIIYEDYVSRDRVVDMYYDELSAKDMKKLTDDAPGLLDSKEDADNFYEAYPYSGSFIGGEGVDIGAPLGYSDIYDEFAELEGGLGSDLLPYDVAGNVRVVTIWWKSKRKIYKVKSFDPETGEEVFDFYPETYVPDKDAGETVETLWVNEAWQGTKIGEDIYVGIRPCMVQHNTIDNPSRCHFGIVGTIYNINESMPYSLVDMMKPYNYLYDAVHAKLVEMIATNWGKLVELDLALKPKNWEVEKWIYFARVNKILIKDSFREGDKGAATGKLAGGLNNATKGYVDADWGNSIQNYINILQWTKDSMSDLVGINRQREGNTYNRETVGGIERAVLQSSYITDWLFMQHEDTERRVLNCWLDYLAASLKGREKVFRDEMPDGSMKIFKVNGDDFAMSSYGILIDNSQDTQKMESVLEGAIQAAAQNNRRLSTLVRFYAASGIQEKARILEADEQQMEREMRQQQQAQQQLEQQKIQAQQQIAQMEMQQKDMLNQRDNDTRVKVAELNARAEYLRLGIYEDQNNEELRREEMDIDREKLRNEILKLDREFNFKEKELAQKKEIELKKIAASKQKTNSKK